MRILRAGMIALASLAVVGALAGTLSAQASKDNSGNPAILAAVKAVQGTANDLLATLNALVTTVNGINVATTPGNVLFTATLVAEPPDVIICSATNVSADPHSVTVQLVNGHNAASLDSTTASTLAPGNTALASFEAPPVTGVRAFCKITVNNGTKNDVRGVLASFILPNGSDKDPIAAQ